MFEVIGQHVLVRDFMLALGLLLEPAECQLLLDKGLLVAID